LYQKSAAADVIDPLKQLLNLDKLVL